jgi:hypothetical protein
MVSLKDLSRDMEKINILAARSLEEGLEEILTLHRLGLNSQIGKYLNKVKLWKNSKEKYRWIAAALLEIEFKMRKVSNFVNLNKIKKIIIEEIHKLTSRHRISTRMGHDHLLSYRC